MNWLNKLRFRYMERCMQKKIFKILKNRNGKILWNDETPLFPIPMPRCIDTRIKE